MSPIPSPARRARAGNGGGVQHLSWWWWGEGGGGGGLLRKGKNPSKKIGRGHVGSVRRGLDFLEIYHMIKWRVS